MATDSGTTLEEFSSHIPHEGALLGLDLGTRTIGLAVSDSARRVAVSLYTLRRTKFRQDAQELQELIENRNIVGLIIGLPVNMDGSEGARCQSTRAFVRNFHVIHPLPIAYWDERLTSIAANRAMLESDMSRKKRKQKIDTLAASLILQSALDRLYELKQTTT